MATIKLWDAGPANLLILYSDGTVLCTGNDAFGQCSLPGRDILSVGEGVTDLAMGTFHANAVVNGRVEAWGNPNSGANNVPEDARTGVIDVASGFDHNIAVKRISASATRLIRWGRSDSGLGNVPDRSDVVAVAAGFDHVLALTTSGAVLLWGNPDNGRGDVPPEAASGIVAIAVGTVHCMALTSDGRVLAWGGSRGQSNVPDEAQSGVIKIDAGSQYSLALRSDGRVIAWGEALVDVTGNQDLEFRPVPITPSGMESGVVDIAALFHSFVARKQDDSAIAFGLDDDDGILGFPAVL